MLIIQRVLVVHKNLLEIKVDAKVTWGQMVVFPWCPLRLFLAGFDEA